MKSTSQILRRILMFTLTLILAFSVLPFSSFATDERYDIYMTLIFSDADSIDHSLEDYQANTFSLRCTSNGTYLKAAYSDTDRCYYITGFTLQEANATLFSCGMDVDQPDKLIIRGLSDGSYELRQLDTTETFVLLSDPVCIEISDTCITVNGDTALSETHHTVPFTIVMSHGFDIPMVAYYPNITLCNIVGMLAILSGVSLLVLIFSIDKFMSNQDK